VGNNNTHVLVRLQTLFKSIAASGGSGDRPAFDKIVTRVQAAVLVEVAFDAADEQRDVDGK